MAKSSFKKGKFNLVDLAATRSKHDVDSRVNKSRRSDCCLAVLEEIISALSEAASYVPYRYVEQGCPIASVLLVNAV